MANERMTRFEYFVAKCGGERKRDGKRTLVCCPAHDDNHASLAVWEGGDGAVLFSCRAGCDKETILRAAGLTWQDCFPDKKTPRPRAMPPRPDGSIPKRVVMKYAYHDAEGKLLCEKWRFDPKGFTFVRYGVQNRLFYGLSAGWYQRPYDDVKKKHAAYYKHMGVDDPNKKPADDAVWMPKLEPPCYLLPEILEAKRAGERIALVEGEKDAQSLRNWTGTPATHWNDKNASDEAMVDLVAPLAGAVGVDIYTDRDSAGYAKAAARYDRLVAAEIPCRIFEPLKGKDVTDHLQLGLSKAQFIEISREDLDRIKKAYDDGLQAAYGPLANDRSKDARAQRDTIKDQFNASWWSRSYTPPADGGGGEPPVQMARPPIDLEEWKQPICDLDGGDLLHARHGEELRWCEPMKCWFEWDGVRWRESDAGEAPVTQRWEHLARTIDERSDMVPHHLAERAERYGERAVSNAGFEAVVKMLRRKAGMAVSPADFDKEPWIVPCLDGHIDLKTGELLPFDRSLHFTRRIPCRYNPEARCPKWVQFLKDVTLGDVGLAEHLRLLVGYWLTAATDEQKFYFLYGPPSGGKSTFMKIVRVLMGEFAGAIDKDSLMLSRQKNHPEEWAVLRGSRICCVPEVMSSDRFNESLLKVLTGEDPMQVRRMYGTAFFMLPTFKVVIWGNNQPKISDQGGSTWRRLVQLPFRLSLPPEKRVKGMDLQLLAELEGILAWAVSGAVDVWSYHSRGQQIPEPAVVVEAANEYRRRSDIFGQFIEEALDVDPTSWETTKRLWDAYRHYCKENGLGAPMSKNGFSNRMEERGFVRDRTARARGFYGASVKNTYMEEMESQGSMDV